MKTTSTPRLFDLCIHFIATHLDHVESFVNFPEEIGKQIFLKAVDLKKLKSAHESEFILNLFGDAYPNLVLSNLVIPPNCDMNFFDISNLIFQYMRGLVVVDLHGIPLGDDKDVLGEQLNLLLSLNCLGLSFCNISDWGVQLLTAKLRIKGEESGLTNLTHLDLSGNSRISDKTTKYLHTFRKLEKLDMSGTTLTEVGVTTLVSIKLQLVTTNICRRPILGGRRTEGWFADVVMGWLQSESKQKEDKRKLKFYSQRKPQRWSPLLAAQHTRDVQNALIIPADVHVMVFVRSLINNRNSSEHTSRKTLPNSLTTKNHSLKRTASENSHSSSKRLKQAPLDLSIMGGYLLPRSSTNELENVKIRTKSVNTFCCKK